MTLPLYPAYCYDKSGILIGPKIVVKPPDPPKDDPKPKKAVDPPSVGQPHFWNYLAQWIVVELMFGVNWLTIVPALIAGYAAFSANLIGHTPGVVIMAALLGLNAFIRSQQSTSNAAKAYMMAHASVGNKVSHFNVPAHLL